MSCCMVRKMEQALVGSSEGKESLFAVSYKREVLPGIGHFIPREQPDAVVKVVMGEL